MTSGRDIAVLMLGAVFLGYLFFSQPQIAPIPQQPDPVAPTGRVVEVVDTDEFGFQPESVTIHQGDAVRFINKTSNPFWPASGVHPTHSIYPIKSRNDCLGSSFDACRDVPPDGSWTFVFQAVGEWRYHDHLEASRTGVVTVIP